MLHCPSDETLADYVEGRLTGEDLGGFHEHVGTCPVCTATLAALACSSRRASSPSGSEIASPGSTCSGSLGMDDWLEQTEIAGRYRPLEILGAGGMGIVYLAQDVQLNRRVALKITRMGVSRGSAIRLLREAQAMACLSHRNVLTVHDVGIWRDHVFVAMEYVKGGTLARHLLEKKRPWRDIVDKFVQAGFGLAEAHRAGLVHRDFKPENVLVSEAGDIRVADFGLARWLTRSKGDSTIGASAQSSKSAPADVLRVRLTRAGTLLGTPAYMAPEQVRGERVDHRADIWSFCAALYEALYCELPFPGRTPHEVLKHVELGSVRRPPVGANVPSWLRRALLRGLHANPTKRYPRMDDLLVSLTAGDRRRVLNRWMSRAAALLAALVATGALSWRAGGKRENTPARHPAIVAPSVAPLLDAETLEVARPTAARSDSAGAQLAGSWSTQRADRAAGKQRATATTRRPHMPVAMNGDPLPEPSNGPERVSPQPPSSSPPTSSHGAPIICD